MENELQFNVVGIEPRFPKRLFKKQFAYVDSEDQQSFRLFERKGLRGFRPLHVYQINRFGNPERYSLIWCELDRSEEEPFMQALQDLHRELLIMGYRDYEPFCKEVFEAIDACG